jgi:hypothetical protein
MEASFVQRNVRLEEEEDDDDDDDDDDDELVGMVDRPRER